MKVCCAWRMNVKCSSVFMWWKVIKEEKVLVKCKDAQERDEESVYISFYQCCFVGRPRRGGVSLNATTALRPAAINV